MWETIARDDDPFICCNFIPIDVKELQDKGFTFQTKKDVHDFIKLHIIGKRNEELVKVINTNKLSCAHMPISVARRQIVLPLN